MPRRPRRHFTPDQKIALLREHLLDRRPISEICQEHGLQPSCFYDWQRKLFEQGSAVFTSERSSEKQALERQVERLESELTHKDYVIARVTEEFVRAKKPNGGT